MKTNLVLTVLLALFSVQLANAGQENEGLPAPVDACGMPLKAVSLVVHAGVKNCSQTIENFPLTNTPGSISNLNGLGSSDKYYLVATQDSAGNSFSAVVKCEVQTGKALFLALQFATPTSYGGCSLAVPTNY